MLDYSEFNFQNWREELERAWGAIPKHFRSDRAVHATLACRLFQMLERDGLRAVAGYLPPLIRDRPVDVIGLDAEERIVCAVCLDLTVTLPAVKSLTSFESERKLVLTTGMLEKKVQESRFFLKDNVDHIHLRPFS